MIKKIMFGLFALPVLTFLGCQWDYFLSNHLFNKYCQDGRVGLFVYEQVELPEEYFEPLPTTWTHHNDYSPDSRYEYGKVERKVFKEIGTDLRKGLYYRSEGGIRIITEKIELDYVLREYEKTQINSIGPIYEVVTSVTRKSDGKLLGQGVSIFNYKGWFSGKMREGFSGGPDICPTGQDEGGNWVFRNHHNNLIKAIFVSDGENLGH